jgi:hypothetical protein
MRTKRNLTRRSVLRMTAPRLQFDEARVIR